MQVVKAPVSSSTTSTISRGHDRTVLTFYPTPPTDEITLTEFEHLAAERLIGN
jgi:hypothetical protein